MPATLKFDHYEVLTRDDGSPFELGRGAMGITYKAFDTSLRIPVALKVINGTYLDSEVARQRFIREARSAAKLRHRHVASVFHLGIDGNAYFYAMELIDGETVESLTKRQGALAPALALQIADQVARAFNAAQPHGLVHRDIKPANLMLVQEDDELVTKVIDFGLAKSSVPEEGAENAATISMAGFVGTPHFASPEQLEEQEIDVRSDIYSLGITLWYMLSGQTPFTGSLAQVMSQHLSKPPPFEKLGPLPAPLATLLGRMLEKDPANRPQTPAALRKEIEECATALRGLTTTVNSPIADEQDYETLLENFATDAVNPDAVAAAQFEVGSTVGGRYAITALLGEANTGRLFQARDLSHARDVRLLLLNRELLEGIARDSREQASAI
ncbi:MAG: serine/threonine-protein kinase, partial [Verrucomicrobiota bacterium]